MTEKRGPGTNRPSVEFEFLTHEPLPEYKGEWVAVVGEEVVAHGPSILKVHAQTMDLRPGSQPLFAKIPRADMMIL